MAELNKAASDTFTATDCDAIDEQMACRTTTNLTHVAGRTQVRTDRSAYEVSTGAAWLRTLQYAGSPQSYTPAISRARATIPKRTARPRRSRTGTAS